MQKKENTLPACQTVYGKNGEILLKGEWDSKKLCNAVTMGNPNYWKGRTVLDLGSNTGGLSLELARMGAIVTAAEPDPYKNNKAHSIEILKKITQEENLNLVFSDEHLFNAHLLGKHDIILCLGLIYHFRDPQYVLDYLSGLDHNDLIVSVQTYPGDGLFMYNRKDISVINIPNFWEKHTDALSGWHPTRKLFIAMLQSAGYTNIQALTDDKINFPKKPEGLTNSAYYKAVKQKSINANESRKIFYPR
ncbi:MAG: hypothetical protein OEZ13_04115 [Spirochaetia bacterium]|nr:hypothetical protein [Spirochaetia bacterium]